MGRKRESEREVEKQGGRVRRVAERESRKRGLMMAQVSKKRVREGEEGREGEGGGLDYF